jgi:hypothetical protein
MTITLDIRPEIEAELEATARAHGLSAEQYARQLLEKALASAGTKKPLSARIRQIWADMPDEVRAKLPADGASQHDHYIYGVPKRAE